jgi:Family of unknown function (DUF5681)
MPFVKGQSGNPAGRPVGSRNKFTRALDEAFLKDGFAVIDTIMEYAQNANPAAMRLCFDRLMGKHRPCGVELPSPEAPDYVLTALTEIHRALGAGEIASDEASRLVDFVGRTARVVASKAVAEIDVVHRLARCEEAILLLLNAGKPAAADSMSAEAAPAQAPPDCNNNAITMPPAAEDGRPTIAAAPADAPSGPRNNETTGAGPAGAGDAAVARKRGVNGVAVEQLMSSTSPLAHMAGVMPGKAMPKMPLMPPRAPAPEIGAG